MLTDLKNRGVLDILILTSEMNRLVGSSGLTGIQEAVEAVYPQVTYQGCVVHVIRNSAKYEKRGEACASGYKNKKEFCADLRAVYCAPTEEAALTRSLSPDWAVTSQDNWFALPHRQKVLERILSKTLRTTKKLVPPKAPVISFTSLQ